MKTEKPKHPRPRIRRARPLLLAAVGAVLLAGCPGPTEPQQDASGVVADMGLPPSGDR